MILKYGRTLAEKQAGGRVVDCVLTVPSYYNQEQRRQLYYAGEMAGLNVVQMVHENVAAATFYGIDRLDEEKPLNVLFYNMGGKDTEVTVARYSTMTDAKNKTHEHVEILGEAYDETLGGQEWDHVLFKILADAFNALPERAGKADVRGDPRAVKRLFKEVVKVKDVLSANKYVDVKVPELLDYVTLKMNLARETFEDASEHLFERVAAPIHAALFQAGLTAADIDQVELLGGGIRIPRVAKILKEVT